MDDGNDLSPLFTLLKYKRLCEDSGNHPGIFKDKTTINYLIYVLDSSDEEVLNTSLTALELLSQSSNSRNALKSTAGLSEALENIVKRKDSLDINVSTKAEHVIQLLDKPPTPKIQKGKKTKLQLKRKVLTLQVRGLHLETQKELEDILTKTIKGVLSVMVDVEHQRCIVTVFENVEPKSLATAISSRTNMEAKLVTRNKFNQEMLLPLDEDDKALDLSDLPPYLDEKDSPVKDKAVRSTKDIRITASQWFSSAAGFLQKSFYW